MLHFLQPTCAARLTTQTSANEHFGETCWNSIITWQSLALLKYNLRVSYLIWLWRLPLCVEVLHLAKEKTLILYLQRFGWVLAGIGCSLCVCWSRVCGFIACGLRVLPLLSHCSSCGGALGRRRGWRGKQGADHDMDGRSGVSTGGSAEQVHMLRKSNAVYVKDTEGRRSAI